MRYSPKHHIFTHNDVILGNQPYILYKYLKARIAIRCNPGIRSAHLEAFADASSDPEAAGDPPEQEPGKDHPDTFF